VNAVAPGLVDTPWTAQVGHPFAARVTAAAPLKRVCTPSDGRRRYCDCLATTAYVTGQVVIVRRWPHAVDEPRRGVNRHVKRRGRWRAVAP